MTDIIARVAFATCSSSPCICKHKAGFEGAPCRDRALAGIKAMRQCTPEMERAVSIKYRGWPTSEMVWETMIDEILTPLDFETDGAHIRHIEERECVLSVSGDPITEKDIPHGAFPAGTPKRTVE